MKAQLKYPSKTSSTSAGFTLIEVVLVLAIGGLIFLLAFLAFQQVSTNRRDTERRAALSKFIAELQNSYADNRKYPEVSSSEYVISSGTGTSQVAVFAQKYLGGAEFIGPSGEVYNIITTGHTNGRTIFNNNLPYVKDGSEIILYAPGYKCGGTSNVTAETGAFAVAIGLEKGLLCRDIN